MTYKMEENDPWYEEKTRQIDALESQLKKLCGLAEILAQCRSDLASATGAFSQGAATLSSTEEAHSLSRALAHLAKVEERAERVHQGQAEADHLHLLELLKDYVALVGAVKDVFAERGKAFQNWRHAQSMVTKKKEQRARLEMGGRTDKVVK
jgi:sorting nexin-1/2